MRTVYWIAAMALIQNACYGISTMTLADLNETSIQEFSEGRLIDVIVECPQGARLPLKIDLNGDILSLGSDGKTSFFLTLLKTCYIRCTEKENFLFSTDQKQWKGFSEFFTGELRVSVHGEEGGPAAGIALELNERKV